MKKFQTPIFYGCVIALAATILMLSLVGLDLLGPGAIASDREMTGGTILFLMIYLFLLFGIYFILKRRKEDNGGSLSFKEAVIQGSLTSLFTAIFSVIFTYLFYEVFYPDYVSELLAALEEKMRLGDIPQDKIDEKIAERRQYYRTSVQSIYSFAGNLITGLAFTLLLGFFLKKGKK